MEVAGWLESQKPALHSLKQPELRPRLQEPGKPAVVFA